MIQSIFHYWNGDSLIKENLASKSKSFTPSATLTKISSKSVWLSWWTSTDLDYLIYLCSIAFAVRLFVLWQPTVVVFDEVHFGGFASQYLNNIYYMDVHPPLAKLLVAFTGWIGGLEKNFKFSAIGVDYLEFQAPYLLMRLIPAILGAAMVPLAYISCRSLGLTTLAALWTSFLVLFENSFVTQFRFILLDAYLAFGTACSVAAWCCFRDRQDYPFSRSWWAYLFILGVSLGFTFSCKWVGLFTLATIGSVTAIDLWNLLGERSISLKKWTGHFFARALCLMLIPSLIYVGSFYAHFLILNESGTAGQQMSIEFQQSLNGLLIPPVPEDVGYGSTISLRHYHSKNGYLHSHSHSYPAGSKQQQITLYSARDDINNYWKIVPARQVNEHINDTSVLNHPLANATFIPLRHNDVIRLIHIATGKFLHSHPLEPPISHKDHYFEVSGYGSSFYNVGDGNDNWIVQLTDENGLPLNDKHLEDDPQGLASNTLLFTTVTRTVTEYEEEISETSNLSNTDTNIASSSSSDSMKKDADPEEINRSDGKEIPLPANEENEPSPMESNADHDKKESLQNEDAQNQVEDAVNNNSLAGQPEKKIKNITVTIDKAEGRKVLKPIKARTSYLRLVHANTGCYLTSYIRKLPEWGFGQFEALCGRDSSKKSSVWLIEHNENPLLLMDAPKTAYKDLSFWDKFVELNKLMWNLNAGLTAAHHFGSRPESWLTLRRGVGFWNGFAQGKVKNVSIMNDREYKEFLKDKNATDPTENQRDDGPIDGGSENLKNIESDKVNPAEVPAADKSEENPNAQLIHTVWHNGQFIDSPELKSRHKYQQIYLIGNPIIWWSVSGFLAIYLALIIFILFREHRGVRDMAPGSSLRLTSSAGFLFIGWAFHYFPFFLMKRQLFLHHYLPAYFLAILLFGFLVSRFIDAFQFQPYTLKIREKRLVITKNHLVMFFFGSTFISVVTVFVLFSPLSYGLNMSKEQCLRIRWFASWDFDCDSLTSSLQPAASSM